MGFKKRVRPGNRPYAHCAPSESKDLEDKNEWLREHDGGRISREENYRRKAEYMEDKHGYDIGS